MTKKLEDLGEKGQKMALKLKVEGLSNDAIKERLNMEFDADLSLEQVKNYLNRNKSRRFQMLKEDKKFQQKLQKYQFDSATKLNDLVDEMWKFFYNIKDDPEHTSKQVFCPKCDHKFRVQLKSFGTFLKTAEHLLNQIKHADSILKNTLKAGNTTYNINVVDFSRRLTMHVPKMLENMEKNGIIPKYNKKRLKKYILD